MKTRLAIIAIALTMPVWVIPCLTIWVLSGETTLFGYFNYLIDKII